MENPVSKRYWEIDSLRGIAIIMMITFHLLFDLNFFNVIEVETDYGFWLIFGRATVILFLLLVGVSLTLSYTRIGLSTRLRLARDDRKSWLARDDRKSWLARDDRKSWLARDDRMEFRLARKFFIRGLKIFSWGLIVSFVTWLFLKEGYVRFGILHLIGVSIILVFPLLKYKYINLFMGAGIILVGMFLKDVVISVPWLLWLGFVPDDLLYTVDYFPLIPWLGVILIGMFFGKVFYPDYKRKFTILNLSNSFIIKTLSYLGKHSLIIYLIHQPLILLIFYTLGYIEFN